ncbi:MAG: haloacid dehalogenase type II [Xanthobacteraceae bacterium]
MTIRALVFDAYGTLYDVQSVRALAVELCGNKGELVTQLWRLKQLEYTWLRGLMQDYKDFWCVTRASLEFALESVGVAPSPSICEPLMQKYLNLDLYPEARAALEALKSYKLAILSNGSPQMLEALVKTSGISHLLANVTSVDLAKTYKPNPAAYALVEPLLGTAKGEILFVSSNGFDVVGAKHFGFNVAWIERGGGPAVPTNSDVTPFEFFKLLRGRAEALEYAPDFRIRALDDLLPLLSESKGDARLAKVNA